MDPHSETDLGEGCIPVGRQFGLLCVKHSLSPCNIECFLVYPKAWTVVKCILRDKIKKKITKITIYILNLHYLQYKEAKFNAHNQTKTIFWA